VSLGALGDAGVRELLDPAAPVRSHYEELARNLLGIEGTGIVVVTSPDPGAGRTSVCLEHHGYEVIPGLLVVPTGPVLSDPTSILENEGVPRALRYLQESRDLVLLDAPVARGVLRSRNLSGGFDGVLLVVHASRTPKDAAREAADDLLAAGVNLLGVVLNGCS
jgi:Mrp family chromosome partitioning ATPase